MNELKRYDFAVRSAASDLEKQGYSVIIEPDPAIIPFDLHQYRPDILATRGAEHLLVEIKARGSHRPIERYKEIAEIVGRHDNWRFMLSTIDDINQTTYIQPPGQLDVDAINLMLDRLESILVGENYDLILPYLWSLYIAAMRFAGQRAGVPVDSTSDKSVLNSMYSLGEISSEELELARRFLQLRNEAVHNFKVNASKHELLSLYEHTKNKLVDWGLIA